MKKYFAITILVLSSVFNANAQTARGVKIGYIDMNYILQNVPDYSEAKSQLEQKAQKWKQEIEAKKVDIAKLKDALKTERALLTKELIDEREEEIKFQDDELLDFQQKKFGPDGDLMTQKAVLVKPIQDQVFTAVQDIAEAKKYDFVFDKSSDLTMLFAANRYDISEQVIRVITRAEKREQMSKKEVKAQEAKEALEDEVDNPSLVARKKALEDKKKAREDLVAQRKADAEAAKAAKEAKRADLLAAKKGGIAKTGTVPATTDKPSEGTAKPTETNKATKDSAATVAKDAKAEKAAARAKLLDDKKKALEDKKKKALEDREAAKKAKEDAKVAKDSDKQTETQLK